MSARPMICVRAGCGYVEDAAPGLEHCERPMRRMTAGEYRELRKAKRIEEYGALLAAEKVARS